MSDTNVAEFFEMILNISQGGYLDWVRKHENGSFTWSFETNNYTVVVPETKFHKVYYVSHDTCSKVSIGAADDAKELRKWLSQNKPLFIHLQNSVSTHVENALDQS